MPRVLVVDDSTTARLALRRVVESDSRISIVGEARNRATALRLLAELKPDVIIMDVCLAADDGVAITAEIMVVQPTPVIVVTAVQGGEPELVFRAMQAGALDVQGKPPAAADPAYARYCRRLTRTITMLARTPVVRRHRRVALAAETTAEASRPLVPPPQGAFMRAPALIAIGASTGGPPVLQQLLSGLPAPFPVPIAIVQHITIGFTAGLATWLQQTTGHYTVLCSAPQKLMPGTVYIAADDHHLSVLAPGLIGPTAGPPRGFLRPCVDELFESAACALGSAALGVLLTGMGDDGAEGMVALHQAGATTIAQSVESCAVGSMPAAAVSRHCVTEVLPPADIARALRQLAP